MTQSLVVYYSRSGTTRHLAHHICEALGARAHEISEPRHRTGWMGYIRSSIESFARGVPAISDDFDPSSYRLVVVGTPIWAGTIASPMRSFLFLRRRFLGQVAFFATAGAGESHAARRAIEEMKALCNSPSAPSFIAAAREVRKQPGAYKGRLAEFVGMMDELALRSVPVVA